MRALLSVAAIALTGAVLSGCIIVDADVDGDFDVDHNRERLYAASIEPDGVRVRVASNGCTTEESFGVDVDHKGDDRYTVAFERENPDHCRAMLPDGVELFFPRSRLGLPDDATIRIRNPIGR